MGRGEQSAARGDASEKKQEYNVAAGTQAPEVLTWQTSWTPLTFPRPPPPLPYPLQPPTGITAGNAGAQPRSEGGAMVKQCWDIFRDTGDWIHE